MCLCWNLKSLFVRDSEQEGDTVMRSWCKCNDETGGVGLFSRSVCVCVTVFVFQDECACVYSHCE